MSGLQNLDPIPEVPEEHDDEQEKQQKILCEHPLHEPQHNTAATAFDEQSSMILCMFCLKRGNKL